MRMSPRTGLIVWLLSFVLCALAVWALIVFADAPVHRFVDQRHILLCLWRAEQHISQFLVPLLFAACVALFLRYVEDSRSSNWWRIWLFAVIVSLFALGVTDVLKFFFGRADLEAWHRLRAYGFHFVWGWHPLYGSFPSGHATYFAATFAVLWALYPRWRSIYALSTVLGDIELVALHYHYLSDTVAGNFIGATVVTTCMFLVRNSGLAEYVHPQPRPQAHTNKGKNRCGP